MKILYRLKMSAFFFVVMLPCASVLIAGEVPHPNYKLTENVGLNVEFDQCPNACSGTVRYEVVEGYETQNDAWSCEGACGACVHAEAFSYGQLQSICASAIGQVVDNEEQNTPKWKAEKILKYTYQCGLGGNEYELNKTEVNASFFISCSQGSGENTFGGPITPSNPEMSCDIDPIAPDDFFEFHFRLAFTVDGNRARLPGGDTFLGAGARYAHLFSEPWGLQVSGFYQKGDDAERTGLELAALYSRPLTPNYDLLAYAGGGWEWQEIDLAGSASSLEEDSPTLHAGIGLRTDFNRRTYFRTDIQVTRALDWNETYLDVNLGVGFKLGKQNKDAY